jgi:hypothetical protein
MKNESPAQKLQQLNAKVQETEADGAQMKEKHAWK